jgi:hypothetical protein
MRECLTGDDNDREALSLLSDLFAPFWIDRLVFVLSIQIFADSMIPVV